MTPYDTWIQRDGTLIRMDRMDDDHLRNAYRMVKRQWRNGVIPREAHEITKATLAGFEAEASSRDIVL